MLTDREAIRRAVEKEKRKAEARLRVERERAREKLRAERRRARQRLLAERKRARERLIAERDRNSKERRADRLARAAPALPKRSSDTAISPRLKRRVETLGARFEGRLGMPDPAPNARRPRRSRAVPPGILQHAAAIVAKQFDLELADLNSRAAWGRVRPGAGVSFARQVLRYLLTVEFDLPMAVVGNLLGCDRTTVRHGNRLIEDRRDDATFDTLMNGLGAMVRSCIRIPPIQSDAGR